MRIAIIAVAAALFGMSAAHAADLRSGSMKDTPVVENATPIWGGLYIGGSVGFGTGDTTDKIDISGLKDSKEPLIAETSRKRNVDLEGLLEKILQSDYSINGAIYGLHVGYNLQRGNLVYGVEAGFNGTNMDGSSPCVVLLYCQREVEWYGTGVGRIGYAQGNSMFYGFGGVAWGKVKTKVGLVSPGITLLEGEETQFGWTAGVGIEHAFNDRFSARIEYAHIDFGDATRFSAARKKSTCPWTRSKSAPATS